MYTSPLTLIQNAGNNAFNFDRRLGEIACAEQGRSRESRLHIPSLIEGTLDDVQIGDQIVFEDFDEYDQLQSCIGLKHFVRFPHPQTGKPMLVVDNHNHVFWFWYEAWHKKQIHRGATLVHIDGHRDTRPPERNPRAEEVADLSKLYDYTQNVLNVGNYIPPAMEEGLIGKLISITSEGEMETSIGGNYPLLKSLIVNIDLDFWAPELDYIDSEKKDRFAREWMNKAGLITFSTSPFFMDQALAIGVLRRLLVN